MQSKKTVKENRGPALPNHHVRAPDSALLAVQTEVKHADSRTRAYDRTEKQKMAAIFTPSPFSLWMQTWLPIIFSGLLLLVIVVQAYIYKKQWEAMNKQFTASTSAERAHVMFESITLHGIKEVADGSESDGKIYVTYVMRNYGKTPAWTTNITFQALITDKFDLPRPPAYYDPTSTPATYAILPNVPFETFHKFEIQRFTITKTQAQKIL